MMGSDENKIVRLDDRGIGIAANGVAYPYSLVGETVLPTGDNSADLKISNSSPRRIKPICQHFGRCGGCALQHFDLGEYLKWKRQLVVDAFGQVQLDVEVDKCIEVAAGLRRRAMFNVQNTPSGIVLGFMASRSHQIIDLDVCPVLLPSITDALSKLRQLASIVATRGGDLKISVLACDNGLDIALISNTSLGEQRRKLAIDWAINNRIARLSDGDEVIIETTRPQLKMGSAAVSPPPGGFVQAVLTSEQKITEIVRGHLGGVKKAVDLFSGSGTFTLRLIKKSVIHSVEFDKPSLTSLQAAAGHMSGIKKLTTEHRDLFRRPLQKAELEAFDGAVFNPPRAGAVAQATELANSKISKICAVSCNPQTLARDAKILVDGGYTIKRVTPVDQFLFTPHVEIVALFERRKVRPQRSIFG